jgi:opacity protein-like surface antigen
MKKIILATLLVASSSSVLAAGAFDGPYIQLGAGMVNNSNKVSSTYDAPISADLSKDGAIGQVLAGYSYNVSDKFNIAANIFYNFGDDKSGSLNLTPYSVNTKLKNVWGVAFEPGYYFTDKTLGYVKLGYQRGDVKLDVNAVGNNVANTEASEVDAFLYGFGIKQLVTSNVYVGAELSRADYSKESLSGTYVGSPGGAIPTEYQPKGEASQTLGLVTLGYKF